MAVKRRAIDLIAEARFGGIDDGSPEWGTTTTPIAALLRDLSIENSGDVVDAAGLASPTALIRFAGNLRFTARGTMVVNANVFPLTDSGGPMVGQYMELQVRPDSTAATPNIWQGIITRWELRAQRNDIQEVQFELQGPIDA